MGLRMSATDRVGKLESVDGRTNALLGLVFWWDLFTIGKI